jgi:hypothetical protein
MFEYFVEKFLSHLNLNLSRAVFNAGGGGGPLGRAKISTHKRDMDDTQ